MAWPTKWWRSCRILVLASLLVLGGTAAAIAENAPAQIRIAFVNPGKHDEFFWPAVSAAMQAAADQFGFALEIQYAERDAQAIGRLGRAIIARAEPPDFLILVNEFQAGAALLRAADARGIKTVMLLNSFYGADAVTMGAPGAIYPHWIGSLIPDNRAAGRRMANALAACARRTGAKGPDGKYHILALLGDSTTPASLDRTDGMRATLAAHPDIVLDREFNTNWQTPKGHDLTANFLTWAAAHKMPTAGIWAANDALALGAIAAAEARQRHPGKDLCVVGLNWSPEALALVRDGKMEMTDGGHFLAGGWAMVMIHDYLAAPDEAAANALRRAITFEMAPIDQGNVVQFFARLGDRDWRRIDFKRFSRQSDRPIPDGVLQRYGGYDFSLRETLEQTRPLPGDLSTN